MKTVFVTGASSGVGKAAALLFAAHGWNVMAAMRNPDQHEEFNDQENILKIRLDVTDPAAIALAISESILRFGSIDALVNSAGYGLMGAFESATMEQIRKQYEVNVFGLMQIMQAVLPYMRKQGGCIINLSSFGGVVALPFGSLYNSSKFAVEGLSEALSHEVAPFNIRVKIIEPGSIDTNFRSNLEMIKADPAYDELTSAFFPRFRKLTEQLPKNTAEDVAETIYRAATDNSDQLRYVSGSDAQFYIDLKYDNNDAAFVAKMRQYFLHT